MQTIYHVYWFDIARELMPPLWFLVLGAFICRVRVFGKKRERGLSRAFYFVFTMIFMVFGLVLLSHEVVQGLRYKSALRNNRCRVVEGPVEVLAEGWPRGKGTNGIEHIRVGTNEFKFSGGGMTYHWLVREGGPLTNGAYARLHVLDEHILKVEIER